MNVNRPSYDMKNYADLGGCYLSRLDLDNSSYDTHLHSIIANYYHHHYYHYHHHYYNYH